MFCTDKQKNLCNDKRILSYETCSGDKSYLVIKGKEIKKVKEVKMSNV